MTDAIEKLVYPELYNNFQEKNYILRQMTDMTGPLGRGDSIEIISNSAPTDNAADTAADGDTYSPGTVTTLSLDQDVFYNVYLPGMTNFQRLKGAWASELARSFTFHAKNAMDSNLIDYLNFTTAWDGSASYHVNAAADALSNGDLMEAIALLESSTGRNRDRFLWVLHPYGAASVNDVSSFIPNQRMAEMGDVGLPLVGTIGGIPAVVSTQCNRNRTVACTAVSISSNVATVTVASGHGIEVGQKVTIADITTPLTTATAVASSASTSFTVALTDSDGAMADGAGTVTVVATENLLIDRDSVWTAVQQAPRLRTVDTERRSGANLQLFTAYGRTAIAGGVCVVGSPVSAI